MFYCKGTYNSVLRALSLHNEPMVAAQRADRIYDHLHALSEVDKTMKPDRLTVKAMVAIWSRVQGQEVKDKLSFYREITNAT